MTPQIALDLSLDTIAVLSRAPEGGWWREGTVRLSEPDMPERLSKLRDVAEARVGPDFVSVLVLPDSQLLYTSLERDDRRPDDTIRSLLKGRTPYAVEDLTWDYVERGDRLQVAVVALDTLIEAETFAAEYGFRPVAVAASPSDPAYPGIPSFGKTGLAGDLLNGEPLDLALDGGFRAIPAPPLPMPEPELGAEPEEVAPEAEADPASVAEDAQEVAEATPEDAPAEAGPDPEEDAADAPLPTFRRSRAEAAPEGPVFTSPRKEAPAPQDGFASTRAGTPEPPVARTASGERLARIAPRLTAQPGPAARSAPPLPTPADIEVTGKRATRYPASRATVAEPPITSASTHPTSFDAPKKADVPQAEPKVPPVAAPGSFAAHLKRRASDPEAIAEWHAEAESRQAKYGETPPAAEAPAKRYDVPREDAPASLAARIKRRSEGTKAQDKVPQPALKADLPEAAALALPGVARDAAKSRGGSRLGLVMTLGLLAVLVLIGLAATLLGDDNGEVAAPPEVPASAAPMERADLPVPALDEAAPETDLAVLLPEPGSVTTGSAGLSIIAAPEPIEGPVLARRPDQAAQSEDQLQADVAPSLAAAPALETAPNAETSPAVFIEIWEAAGAFEAPDLAAPPAPLTDPQPVPATLDPVLTGLATPSLPQVAALPTALAPRRDPPPAELVESRDAALGLVPATPDWTVLPEGYALLRGRPATLPRARPGGAAEARLAALEETPRTTPDETASQEIADSDGAEDVAEADSVEDTAEPTAAVLPDGSDTGSEPILVAATADGTVAPGGYTVLQGRPATLPLRRPETEVETAAVAEPETPEPAEEDQAAASGDPATDASLGIPATPDGVVAPGGYTLVLGRPATLPEPRPEDDTDPLASTEAFPADAPLADPEGEATATLSEPDAILRRVRPVERPSAIDAVTAARSAALAAEAEAAEAAPGEMRRVQPRQRPEAISTAAEEAEAALRAAQAATEQAAVDAAQQAAAASLANAASAATTQPAEPISNLALIESERPRTRPRSVERDAATIVTQRRQVAAAASAATTQPRQPEPSAAPTSTQQIRSAGGNVARAATQQNAIRLNRINLIGVYGRSNARRALVRLSNGRYVKVEVGDRLDRGRVVAIGEDRIQYQRGGRNVVLELPRT